jgi:cytochrome P450
MNRKVLKDFTFSSGLTLPAGTMVSVTSYPIHTDETKYTDAHTFQGFRFADIRESASSEALKHHMVTPRNDYLLFGHGRHACPGRFFAVNELKLMLSHILLTYDVKLPNDSHTPPASRWIGAAILPDERAEVLFRARA